MRANDLIWSSVVNHYLLDQPAPPSDLLYWFEDGARIPAAFLKSYNRDLLLNNSLKEPAGFKVGDVAIDLAAIKTPMLVDRAQGRSRLGVGSGLSRRAAARRRLRSRRLGPQCRRDQPARREQARLSGPTTTQPDDAERMARKRDAARRQLVAVLDQMARPARQRQAGRRARKSKDGDRAGAGPLRDDAVMDVTVTSQDVLTNKEGLAGRLRLNRPKALHSLNRQMVRDMAHALIEWRDDPDVRIILIDHTEGPRLLRRRRRRRHLAGRRGP